jgi:pimeloyl-ACP methyl ester carboxylesterase
MGAAQGIFVAAAVALCLCFLSPELAAGDPPKLLPGEELVPMPTLGGTQFWADEFFFHQWHIQRNVLDGHCRLLDGNNLRYAAGDYLGCRAVLEKIRRNQHFPPMQGKAVVLLHGLGAHGGKMEKLASFLRQHGGYTVFKVTYPSTRRDVAGHADALAHIIAHLDGIDEIHFVAHSLGNIVIRHYLADRYDPVTGRQGDPRIGRFVMLGPPNQGSLVAVALAENQVFATLTGPAGQQLGRQWNALRSHLATPRFEFGVIAGGRGDGRGYNPFLPGDNDGILTVLSTRLSGARDFLVVPSLHAVLPEDSRAMQATLCFLQHGYFISAAARRPIRDDPIVGTQSHAMNGAP